MISFHLTREIFSPNVVYCSYIKTLRQSLGLGPALHWSLGTLSGEVTAQNQYHILDQIDTTDRCRLHMKLTGGKKNIFFSSWLQFSIISSGRDGRDGRKGFVGAQGMPGPKGIHRDLLRTRKDFPCFNRVKKNRSGRVGERAEMLWGSAWRRESPGTLWNPL